MDPNDDALAALAPGVHAWLSQHPTHGRANAGVVVEDDGVTVVDSLMVASQWESFAGVVEAMGRPVPRVVLTSSHVEFSGGTSRFRMSGVYGTRQASALLDQPANVEIFRRLFPEFAPQFGEDFRTRAVTHVITEAAYLTPAVLTVPTRGQTLENLVVAVPGADIVFAGAMCSFGVVPAAYDGDPSAWAEALDQLVELAPIVVPGHGPIGGEEEVRELQAYLRACVAADGDPGRVESGPWDDWSGQEWTEVNVERAAMLAAGDPSPPPSLLARLGLI
jgi:glyoxylase-like metal-dependent hydrolase (beta-lactamase superfamily II)